MLQGQPSQEATVEWPLRPSRAYRRVYLGCGRSLPSSHLALYSLLHCSYLESKKSRGRAIVVVHGAPPYRIGSNDRQQYHLPHATPSRCLVITEDGRGEGRAS